MYKNKLDKLGTCAKDGKSAEEQFRKLAEQRGYTVKDACLDKQFAHIDFTLEKDGHEYHFEVKARKKLRRQDKDYADSFLWVEIKNVRGDSGWLYGDADIIVAERENDFLLVSRKNLVDLAEKLINFEETVDKPHKALRKIYRRFKRKDQISYIEMAEIEKLEHSLWPKL